MLGARRRLPEPVSRVWVILVSIAVLSVLVRLWALGSRVAHWDEARIAFWVLQYGVTGEWTYHPVFHGPLLFHVERWLFASLGPSDFVMRLPSAFVGGLLPLAAWLFRDHLDDGEVLAMGVLLAANPILVYYSRFMRNDVLVAAFSLVALGFVLRLLATGRFRYAAGFGLFLGAALGSKENALLYVLAWVGAGVLLWAWRANANTRPLGQTIREGGDRIADRIWSLRMAVHAMLAAAVGFLVLLWVYAPRGNGPGSFRTLLDGPEAALAVGESAIIQPPMQAISFWALGSAQGEYPYHLFFGLLVGLLVVGAAGTVLFAGIGLARNGHRDLVAFAGLWALLSIVGYPAAADLMAGWTALHVVVPLSIPGAVGLASVVRTPDGRVGVLPGRRALLVLLGVYLVVSIALTSFAAPGSTYNPLGQPSQMGEGSAATIAALQTALQDADGEPTIDGRVAYIGSYWESHVHRLPILWYVERAGADRLFVEGTSELGTDPPTVLITHENRSATIKQEYPTYECRAHERVPWAGGRPDGLPGKMVVCIDREE